MHSSTILRMIEYMWPMYFGKQCTELLQILIANNIPTNIENIVLFFFMSNHLSFTSFTFLSNCFFFNRNGYQCTMASMHE